MFGMQNDDKDTKDKKKSNRKKDADSTKVYHYKYFMYMLHFILDSRMILSFV